MEYWSDPRIVFVGRGNIKFNPRQPYDPNDEPNFDDIVVARASRSLGEIWEPQSRYA
jgi:hypothetical protein